MSEFEVFVFDEQVHASLDRGGSCTALPAGVNPLPRLSIPVAYQAARPSTNNLGGVEGIRSVASRHERELPKEPLAQAARGARRTPQGLCTCVRSLDVRHRQSRRDLTFVSQGVTPGPSCYDNLPASVCNHYTVTCL